MADPREALARALGDPSLALGYWFAAESRYIDRDGEPVELPAPAAAAGPRRWNGMASRSPC